MTDLADLAELLSDPILAEGDRLPGAAVPTCLECFQDPELREMLDRAVALAAASWQAAVDLIRALPDPESRSVVAETCVLRLMIRVRALQALANAGAEQLGRVPEEVQRRMYEQAVEVQRQFSAALHSVIEQLLRADQDTLDPPRRAQLLNRHLESSRATVKTVLAARNQAVADSLDSRAVSASELARALGVKRPAVTKMARTGRQDHDTKS